MNTLDFFMKGLMDRYAMAVPNVNKITAAMIANGMIKNTKEIENDHVAFRTLGVEHLGIKSLEKIFLHHGYTKQNSFNFIEKKLNANWYMPPAEQYPRIFISELRVDELSEDCKKIIYAYTDAITYDPIEDIDLNNGYAIDDFMHKPLWATPTWAEYNILQKESEYAAWVIYNRYYLNHYTISVHNLPKPYCDIFAFNDFLESIGVKLNNAGGKVKVSPDGGLLQSSTVAEMLDAEFAEGSTHSISGSYVEFAERKVLNEYKNLNPNLIERKHRREGFETNNADKIFESTFSSQTERK